MSGRRALALIGGLDPTGGAGVLRDLWTAAAVAPELRTFAVITAFTLQGRGAPARALPRPWARVAAEVALLPRGAVIKVGAAPAPVAEALAAALTAAGGPAVVDPVLWASDGGALGDAAAARALARVAALVTPNVPEAAALAGARPDDPELLVRTVDALGGRTAVLLKGGHAGGVEVRDLLWVDGATHTFARPRRAGPDPRGTGCALATAIAAGLGRGSGLVEAVAAGIAWLDEARGRWEPGPEGAAHLPGPLSSSSFRNG